MISDDDGNTFLKTNFQDSLLSRGEISEKLGFGKFREACIGMDCIGGNIGKRSGSSGAIFLQVLTSGMWLYLS